MIFSQHTSILVVLLYIWRLDVNAKKYSDLEDVYYGTFFFLSIFYLHFPFMGFYQLKKGFYCIFVGVQIANMAIISTQVFMVALSGLLFYAIYKVKFSFIFLFIFFNIKSLLQIFYYYILAIFELL